jgi:hypothetical protein
VCTILFVLSLFHATSHDVALFVWRYPSWPAGPREAITKHSWVIDKDIWLTILSYSILHRLRSPPPDEGRNVFFLSAGVIAAAFAVFAFTRMFASPIRPRTMTKEWQEATEEYMKVRILFAAAIADICVAVESLTRHSPKEPSPSRPTRA